MHGGLICIALHLSVTKNSDLKLIHTSISNSIAPMAMKLSMDVGGPKDYLEGQAQGHQINVIFDIFLRVNITWVEVKHSKVIGHLGQRYWQMGSRQL